MSTHEYQHESEGQVEQRAKAESNGDQVRDIAVTEWRRRGTVGFLLAGVGFVTASVVSFAVGRPLQILDVLMVVALLLVLVGTIGLYTVQRDAFSRLGRLSAVVAVVGLVVATVGTAAAVVAPGVARIALVGLPLTWLGFVALGVATARACVLPRWTGVVLAIAFPGAVLLFVLPVNVTFTETGFSFYPGPSYRGSPG